jgi:uncharacterized membrane protein
VEVAAAVFPAVVVAAAAAEHPADGETGASGMSQKPRHQLARHVDEDRIRDAIIAAEQRTTGPILVTLSHGTLGTTLTAAKRAFRRLRLGHAPDRNGVLLFVIPERREFAVVGDTAIHEKVGQEFWERVAGAMSDRIQRGDITDGLIHGVEEAGQQLALHFPRA